ncbi:hypothetical protein FRC12_019516 [Ceratobasidium sp. 428]|nr:hypothetical protein FRC12_019516 [Ceratobasidium sp. 428]
MWEMRSHMIIISHSRTRRFRVSVVQLSAEVSSTRRLGHHIILALYSLSFPLARTVMFTLRMFLVFSHVNRHDNLIPTMTQRMMSSDEQDSDRSGGGGSDDFNL